MPSRGSSYPALLSTRTKAQRRSSDTARGSCAAASSVPEGQARCATVASHDGDQGTARAEAMYRRFECVLRLNRVRVRLAEGLASDVHERAAVVDCRSSQQNAFDAVYRIDKASERSAHPGSARLSETWSDLARIVARRRPHRTSHSIYFYHQRSIHS